MAVGRLNAPVSAIVGLQKITAPWCGRDLTNFKLPTVYEAVTHTALLAHHNARTDAYACAVIMCRLLGCDDGAVRARMQAGDSRDVSAAICAKCI